MRKLLFLAVLAVGAYFAYTEGLPRYRAHQESQEAEREADTEAAQARTCILAADGLARDLLPEIRQFAQPSANTSAWSTLMLQMSGQLSAADANCRCATDACASAGAALLEMRRLLNQVDSTVRGLSSTMPNLPRAQERIDRLLDRARSEAG